MDLFVIATQVRMFWPQPFSIWLRPIVTFLIWALPDHIVELSPQAPAFRSTVSPINEDEEVEGDNNEDENEDGDESHDEIDCTDEDLYEL